MASLQGAIIRFLIRRANIWNKPLNQLRQDLERIGEKVRMPGNVTINTISDEGARGEWIKTEKASKDKVIMYVHGGGGCIGIYNSNRKFAAELARNTLTDIFMVDYRLAPENPYPAALEDTIGAYRWLLHKEYKPCNIVFAGDSSGCGLCISALNALRIIGEAMPAAMAFITPMVDYMGSGESMTTRAAKDPFRYIDPLYNAKLYIGSNDPTEPLISPLYGDLSGLPPMLIHAADYDVFLSDAVRLAKKADEAGVNVKLKVWDKMWHIFHMQADAVPESKAALKEICSFIKEHIA